MVPGPSHDRLAAGRSCLKCNRADDSKRRVMFRDPQTILQRREVRKCCARLERWGSYEAWDGQQRAEISRLQENKQNLLASKHPATSDFSLVAGYEPKRGSP